MKPEEVTVDEGVKRIAQRANPGWAYNKAELAYLVWQGFVFKSANTAARAVSLMVQRAYRDGYLRQGHSSQSHVRTHKEYKEKPCKKQ